MIQSFTEYVLETNKMDNLDVKEGALLLRQELKRTFPSTNFRVTLSRYSGGSSIRVAWVDGPCVWQVDLIADKYEGRGFDGSTDSSYFKKNVITRANGTKALAPWSFVSTNRTMSPALRSKILSLLTKKGFSWAKDVEVRPSGSDGGSYFHVPFEITRNRKDGFDSNSIERTLHRYASFTMGNGILAVPKNERL